MRKPGTFKSLAILVRATCSAADNSSLPSEMVNSTLVSDSFFTVVFISVDYNRYGAKPQITRLRRRRIGDQSPR